MVEAHALAVVDTGHDLPTLAVLDLESHRGGARVARVLQQLANENPGVGAVAVCFELRAVAKCFGAGEAAAWCTPRAPRH